MLCSCHDYIRCDSLTLGVVVVVVVFFFIGFYSQLLIMILFLTLLFLFCAGDVALGGRKLSEEEGHFNDNRKPSGFDTKQIFVSPSVRYSGRNCYAKPKRQLETLHVSSLAYVYKATGRIFDWLKNLPPHFFRTEPLIILLCSHKTGAPS